jgi:RNA polymerase sigma-70 factor (ECF subfamily)
VLKNEPIPWELVDKDTEMRSGQASVPHLFVVTPARAGASDAELVSSALEGDSSAAAAFWSRYIVLVRALLRGGLGTNDVDDISQEVFINVYKSLADLRNCNSLRRFIIAITLNLASTELRRRRARDWLRLTRTGSLSEFDVPACDDPEAREALRRLYAILDQLGTRARLAFILRYVEGMGLRDVAGGLDISLATAKRLLGRASARVFTLVQGDSELSEYLHRLDVGDRKGDRP